jgi:hypothetical protein
MPCDNNIGFEASDLTADEIDLPHPELYIHLAENATEPLFMKIHDAYTKMVGQCDSGNQSSIKPHRSI